MTIVRMPCRQSPTISPTWRIPNTSVFHILHSQLEAMAAYSCGKYPGIEINYREVVVPTSPEYISESLKAVMDHGFDGVVLSWNIMEAPLSHLGIVYDHTR